jgi:hypothetical protein
MYSDLVATATHFMGDIVCTREDGTIDYHPHDCTELQPYTRIQVINRFTISEKTRFSKGLLSIEGNTPRVVLVGSMKSKFKGCKRFISTTRPVGY